MTEADKVDAFVLIGGDADQPAPLSIVVSLHNRQTTALTRGGYSSGWTQTPCRKWYNYRMAKTLTDLSLLTKAILKESPPPRPVEKPAPEPLQSREDADTAAILKKMVK